MDLETFALLATPGLLAVFVIVERVLRARPLPKVALWKTKGLVSFALMSLTGMFAPLLWLEFVSAHRLMNLEGLGVVGGTVVAFLGIQLVSYAWHRLMHNVPILWRWFHQLHHSAERLDIYGGVFFHPLDNLGFTFIQTVVPFFVLGVRAEAAIVAGLVGLFYSLFQHVNVRTPRWLGYVIQRPESHSVHHGRGIHAFNYGDFPLWDLLFGTFRNPEHFEVEAGFYDGASSRLVEMLVGRDVATPVSSPAPRAEAAGSAPAVGH
jgi:sterol desaturase/sphingolipid hydroxylase (fatty acid hydroxylase superfamily)